MRNNSVAGIIIGVIKKNKALTIGLISASVGAVVLSLIPPQILKIIVDRISEGNERGITVSVLTYFLVIVLSGAGELLKEGMLTILGQKSASSIRSIMGRKLALLPAQYFTKNESGVIVSRITNDVDAAQSLFTNGIVGMLIDSLKIIGIVISMWMFSGGLGVLTVILLPIIYAITRVFQKKMLRAQLLNRKAVARVNGHIPETIRSLQMIRSYSKQDYMEDKYKEYLNDSYKSVEKINFYDSIYSPIIIIIRSSVIAVVVLLCAGNFSGLGISIGTVAAAIEFISSIFSPIESLGMELQGIQEAAAGIERINLFLREQEEANKDNNINKHTVTANSMSPSVEFENVSFHYDNGQEVLNNLNLYIKPAEIVTITGRTGAGKSTLFKLVLGILKPTSGNVRVGGVPSIDIPSKEKRGIFGYVEQSFRFVDGTIQQQITLGDENISKEAVAEALKFVGMYDYVQGLEKGMDTPAKEYMFSQGQRQLLSIARAIAANPPILLLDEMTANLDSETEKNICDVLQKAGENRTMLSISHRLSGMLKCDRKIEL